jgi:hypothetical protein
MLVRPWCENTTRRDAQSSFRQESPTATSRASHSSTSSCNTAVLVITRATTGAGLGCTSTLLPPASRTASWQRTEWASATACAAANARAVPDFWSMPTPCQTAAERHQRLSSSKPGAHRGSRRYRTMPRGRLSNTSKTRLCKSCRAADVVAAVLRFSWRRAQAPRRQDPGITVPSGLEPSADSASRTLKEESCRRPLHRWCCARDGGLLALQRRPSGAGAKPP